MTKRAKLLRSKEYVISTIQLALLNMVEEYMAKNQFRKNQLAADLGVTKGYVSQLMNASYDHKISKMAELSLHCNVMPLLNFVDLDEYIESDAKDSLYELVRVARPGKAAYSNKMSDTAKKSRLGRMNPKVRTNMSDVEEPEKTLNRKR